VEHYIVPTAPSAGHKVGFDAARWLDAGRRQAASSRQRRPPAPQLHQRPGREIDLPRLPQQERRAHPAPLKQGPDGALALGGNLFGEPLDPSHTTPFIAFRDH
jgi:hypothetical protein